MAGRLDGTVAIITGGARGQGEAEARLFVAEGARVLVGDVLDERARQMARSLGEAAVSVHLDVTRPDSWDAAVASCERALGSPTVLVNNAGVMPVASFRETDEKTLRLALDVNLVGAFLGIQAVVPAMSAAGGGAIVNVSSMNGFKAGRGLSAYTTSKFGLRGLTKSAALELGEFGIRVNSIHPGPIETEMSLSPELAHLRNVDDNPFAGRPIPRWGRSDEIARLALFLACGDSSFSTGSEFVADGGALAG